MAGTDSVVLAAQRGWAKSRNLNLIRENRRVEKLEDNLFEPLSLAAMAEFDNGHGSEIKYRAGGKEVDCAESKMASLCSSSALVVNFFLHWTHRPEDIETIARLCGALPGIIEARFEAKHLTGASSIAPANLDVEFRGRDISPLAIESKFCEVYAPKFGEISPSYFLRRVWADLPGCERLAREIVAGESPFRRLDAPQLLKHIGALSKSYGRLGFRLLYLYYERAEPSDWAASHEAECRLFALRIGEYCRFSALSYQALFARLLADGSAADSYHAAYLEYLGTRYFPTESVPGFE